MAVYKELGTTPHLLKDLFKHGDLLIAWTGRTLKARYKQSLLGILWAVVQPVARAIILTIVFTSFIPIDSGPIPYVLFSFTAMVPWMFFSTALTDMVTSLVSNINLVSKIYFPREILPVSLLLSRLVDFGIASVLIMVMLIIYRIPVNFVALLFLPVIILVQLILTLGLGLLGAALNVFYRDINHLFVFIIQILFYATPIIYPISRVPEKFQVLLALNPMTGIVEAFRAVVLYQTFPNYTLSIAAIISILFLLFGYWIFKTLEFSFADVI